ncbi:MULTISPECIES: hypothetical protein [Cupriavidus]|nr:MULTISPECIES: hypothetical protein [Cupriavidus]TPQ35527.1 hypothetical protein C2U69_20705 [Cupriavidus pinatubonensis]
MKTFFAKTILFIIGFGLGCLIDLGPTYVAGVLKLHSCAEDCPTWVRVYAIVAYLIPPFAAGAVMALGRSVGQRALWLLCIALLPLSLLPLDSLRHSKLWKQIYLFLS